MTNSEGNVQVVEVSQGHSMSEGGSTKVLYRVCVGGFFEVFQSASRSPQK